MFLWGRTPDPWTRSSTLLKLCRFTVNQTPAHGQAQNPRHRQHVPTEDRTDYHATHRGPDRELNHLYIQSTHDAWSKGNHIASHFLLNTHHHCLCQWGFSLDWLRYHWWSSGRRHHGVVLKSHSSTMFRMVTGKPSMCSSRWLSKLYFTVVTPVSRSRRLVFCTHKCGLVRPVNWLDLQSPHHNLQTSSTTLQNCHHTCKSHSKHYQPVDPPSHLCSDWLHPQPLQGSLSFMHWWKADSHLSVSEAMAYQPVAEMWMELADSKRLECEYHIATLQLTDWKSPEQRSSQFQTLEAAVTLSKVNAPVVKQQSRGANSVRLKISWAA